MQHGGDIRIQLNCWSNTEPMWMHRMKMYVLWIVESLWCIDPVFYASKAGTQSAFSFWTSWQWFHSTDCNLKITGQNSMPLHKAASRGHCEVVELLIKSGANVNAQGYEVCLKLILSAKFQSLWWLQTTWQFDTTLSWNNFIAIYWSIRMPENRNKHHYTRQLMWNGHHYTMQLMWPMMMMMMKHAPEKCAYSIFCARTELIPISKTRYAPSLMFGSINTVWSCHSQ